MTIEEVKEIFDNKDPFLTKDVDYKLKGLSLLRERIPYDVCHSIISGSEHDVLYLCDVKDALPYLSKEDVLVLADCNMFIDKEFNCFAFFT